MHTHSSQKAVLRRQLRQQRQALDATQRADAAAAVGEHLTTLPALLKANHIATYFAADGEIDPAVAVRLLRERGKHIYLPVIRERNTLAFALWAPEDELAPNRFGIPEPLTQAEAVHAKALDALLLPLVGWDRRGARLGMGGGFYDRSLQGAGPVLKIGLAYACQHVPVLPVESWDISLDYVATEEELVDCTAAKGR